MPGCAVTSVEEALASARSLGVPLLVKAVGGGGGRGMKRCRFPLADLAATLELAAASSVAARSAEESARIPAPAACLDQGGTPGVRTPASSVAAEAGAAFGDARVYLERYVASGRHIEVQVLGDGAGKVIHLGERDCSTQRRYQKLIEETPAPALSAALRTALHAAAVRFAQRLCMPRRGHRWSSWSTGERDRFYFLEMNARIQVEHPR